MEFPSLTVVRYEEITVIHMTEICAGYLCVCVGVHMLIVYSEWSFSAQLFIQGFHGDMLCNITNGDYRVCMTLRNMVFSSVAEGENYHCLECECIQVQTACSQENFTFIGEAWQSKRVLVGIGLTCYQCCYMLHDKSNNSALKYDSW